VIFHFKGIWRGKTATMVLPEVSDDLFRGIVFFVDDSVSAETRPSVSSYLGLAVKY
jgi:hypothetical protein